MGAGALSRGGGTTCLLVVKRRRTDRFAPEPKMLRRNTHVVQHSSSTGLAAEVCVFPLDAGIRYPTTTLRLHVLASSCLPSGSICVYTLNEILL